MKPAAGPPRWNRFEFILGMVVGSALILGASYAEFLITERSANSPVRFLIPLTLAVLLMPWRRRLSAAIAGVLSATAMWSIAFVLISNKQAVI